MAANLVHRVLPVVAEIRAVDHLALPVLRLPVRLLSGAQQTLGAALAAADGHAAVLDVIPVACVRMEGLADRPRHHQPPADFSGYHRRAATNALQRCVHAAGHDICVPALHGVAALCQSCHHDVDQGNQLTKDERQTIWVNAHLKTLHYLLITDQWPVNVPITDLYKKMYLPLA